MTACRYALVPSSSFRMVTSMCPQFVRPSRADTFAGLRGVDAITEAAPTALSHPVVPAW